LGTILLVASKTDLAGMNMRERLLGLESWDEPGSFEGSKLHRFRDFIMTTTGEPLLERDNIDVAFLKGTGIKPDCVVYLSKHRSESNMKSLTVHPIGNFAKAEYGGRDGSLVPASPAFMTGALRGLKAEARELGLKYNVSFEATHHGPYLETPTFFIEIGSGEPEWRDESAGQAIARALLNATGETCPVAVGIGGGHYAPRLTDVALSNKIAFGHIIPSYAAESVDEPMLAQAISKSGGASLAYFHRKAMKKPVIAKLSGWCESQGLRVVREEDLEKM
jgi:D-aminoacyl-tRNA deacylase